MREPCCISEHQGMEGTQRAASAAGDSWPCSSPCDSYTGVHETHAVCEPPTCAARCPSWQSYEAPGDCSTGPKAAWLDMKPRTLTDQALIQRCSSRTAQPPC